MANKTVTYKEPKGYINASMRKAAEDWEKAQKAKEQQKATPKKKTK